MFGGDERAPLCFQVLSAYEKVIGSGREILEMVELPGGLNLFGEGRFN